jgi:hypothetical protein
MIPIGTDLQLPVMVVFVGEDVTVVSGTLLRLDADQARLRVDAAEAKVGRRLVIAGGDAKIPGRITAIDGGVVTVARDVAHGTDNRAAPRVRAPVELTWWTAGDADGWLAGAAPTGPSRTAHGDDVSISGVSFHVDADPPRIGDRLFFEAVVDPAVPASRMVGLVRRQVAIPGGWVIGVEFAEMDESTFDSIADLTLRNS